MRFICGFLALAALSAGAGDWTSALPRLGEPVRGKFGLRLVAMPTPATRQWTAHEADPSNIVFDAVLCRRQLERTGAAWWSPDLPASAPDPLAAFDDARYDLRMWRQRALWPIPRATRFAFAADLKRRLAAGEAVTLEIGVDADGRINPLAAKYLESVAWLNRGEAEPKDAALNPSMTHIQRTMKALAESTAENPARVKIFFYGQSIVAEPWTVQVVDDLRARFPTAQITSVKRAIGGFQAEKLHDCAHTDMYPEYPDLVFFHDYGVMKYYEEMIRLLREKTTAEIVLWTSHLSKKQPVDRNWVEPLNRSAEIRRIARTYGCALIELREKWIGLLEDAGWQPMCPLVDGIHHGPWGARVYGRMVSEELYRLPGEGGHPDITGSWRDIPVTDMHRAADGSLTLDFDGNRVDALTAAGGVGTATVWVDGTKATDHPEIWYATRPSKGPAWMPALRRVFLGTNVVPRRETWTLTLPEGVTTNGWIRGWGVPISAAPRFPYRLAGSVTGPDGEGDTKTDFTSRSGRIVLPSDQMDFLNQCSGFRRELPKGFKITWELCVQCADPYDCATTNHATTLVKGLSNGRHTLVLKPDAGAKAAVRAFRVYTPVRSRERAITISPGEDLSAAVEQSRASGIRTIRLRGGVYPIVRTVSLDARDNGLSIVAAEGERPVLDGGLVLGKGVKDGDGFVSYDLAAAGFPEPKIPFEPFGTGIRSGAQLMVFLTGGPLTEACEPNDDFTGVTEVLDGTNHVFRANLPLAEKLVGAKGLFAHGYYTYGWADHALPVEIARDGKGLVFRLGSLDVLPDWKLVLKEGRPFRLLGSKLFLDRDDEWFFDRAAGRIFVRAAAAAKGAPVVTAMKDPFLTVNGTTNLVLRGLTFRCGRGCGIVADGTVGLVFDRNLVERFCRSGVVSKRSTRARFTRSVFRTFGSSGLVLTGGDRRTLTRGDNLVEDCDFSDGGRFVRSGEHVLVTRGIGNTFLHNAFHDLPGAAVRFDGNDHLFASNVIERCALEADDWGGIENQGSPFYRGSKIVHNLFRDIGCDSRWNYCGQSGVRFDDAISGMYVYGNRFVNAARGGFGGVQVHGGKDNVVENNLFTGCRTMMSVTTWSRDPGLSWWEKQLVRERATEPFSEIWRTAYGDLSALRDAPPRETLRRNVMIGGEALFRYKEATNGYEIVTDGNVRLPEGADWTSVKGFDPLPPESALGVRPERR